MDVKNEYIDLNELINVIKKRWVEVILWTILGSLISLAVSIFIISPKYSSSIDILVNQKNDNTAVQYNVQQADLQVINTYKDILTKPVVLTPVLQEIKKNDNYQGNLSTLSKSIKISNQANSQVITVNVTDDNAYVAADIANAVGKVFSKKIKKMMQVNNVTIVSNAKVNTTPVSPNKGKNVFLGAILGAFVGFMIIYFKELTDKTVKDNSFLTDNLGLTNIGSVYHLDISDNDYGVVKVVARNKISDNNIREMRLNMTDADAKNFDAFVAKHWGEESVYKMEEEKKEKSKIAAGAAKRGRKSTKTI